MKIFVYLYYVVYLFTEISARLPGDGLKIAQIIEFINSMYSYSDEALSNTRNDKYGWFSPKPEPNIILYTTLKHNTKDKSFLKPLNDVQNLSTDVSPKRRHVPENVKLTIDEILQIIPTADKNHVKPQGYNNPKIIEEKDEEIEDSTSDQDERELPESEPLNDKHVNTQLHKTGAKHTKDRRDKDSKRSEDKSSDRLHRFIKMSRVSKEVNSIYLNGNQKIKRESNGKAIIDIGGLFGGVGKKIGTEMQQHLGKIDKLGKEWNKRHTYENFKTNDETTTTEYEKDIGIVDNASDLDMEEEWMSRHPGIYMDKNEKENSFSFERN